MTPPVKKGDRIKLISMPDDPDPIPAGSEGVVVSVTGGLYAYIDVKWDCGRSLTILPDVDRFVVVERKD